MKDVSAPQKTACFSRPSMTGEDWMFEAMLTMLAKDAGCGISWHDVEEHGAPVSSMKEGDAFAVVLADRDLMTLKTFTGVVVRIGWSSVSVQIERGWDNDTITWALETKVIPLPKQQK